MNQYWLMLLVAAGLEIVWAIGLKYTAGFTRLWPSVGTVLAMAASMYLLARAAEGLPIGTAYAVWTGIGAAGTAFVGMFVLHESRDWVRLACIGRIILGVVGLKAFAREGSSPRTDEAVPRPVRASVYAVPEHRGSGWSRLRIVGGHRDLWRRPLP
jgi:quaternary ammonium compound-resistance protein SugE